jgi:hypothetical protein
MVDNELGLVGSPEGMTAEWLTQVLRRARMLDREQVDSFATQTVGTGQMGLSVRYRLHYDRPAPHAPESLICKFASHDPVSRATGIALQL